MTWLVISVCCPFASPVTTTRSTSQSCGSTSPVGTDSSSFASTSRGETFAPFTLIGSALPKPRPTRNFSFAVKEGGKAILRETWRMLLSRDESGNVAHSECNEYMAVARPPGSGNIISSSPLNGCWGYHTPSWNTCGSFVHSSRMVRIEYGATSCAADGVLSLQPSCTLMLST